MNKSKDIKSNSALSTNSGGMNKKSCSNAQFQTHTLKKRGVYVEKRITHRESDHNTIEQKNPTKTHVRPKLEPFRCKRPVLGNENPKIEVTRKQKRKAKADITKEPTGKDNSIKLLSEKTNFIPKSKLLNEVNKKDSKLVFVMKSKKDIIQTPSMYSESDREYKWSECPLPKLVKDDSKRSVISKNLKFAPVCRNKEGKDNNLSGLDADPLTLIGGEFSKQDSKLYNFFVDLLETTFECSKDSCPNPPKMSSSRNIRFLMDESDANKLDVFNNENEDDKNHDEHSLHNHSHNNYVIASEGINNHLYNKQRPKSEPIPKIKKKNPKAKLFRNIIYNNNNKVTRQEAPKSQSFGSPTGKHVSKIYKRKMLIDMFKEELEIDFTKFNEPQNIFQALKAIAKRKSRYNSDHTMEQIKTTHSEFNDPECKFKSKKVFSAIKRTPKRRHEKELNFINDNIAQNPQASKSFYHEKLSDDEFQSNHTLEVIGYDYNKKDFESRDGSIFMKSDTSEFNDHSFCLNKDFLNFSRPSSTATYSS